jgi:hypothetical protein
MEHLEVDVGVNFKTVDLVDGQIMDIEDLILVVNKKFL